MWGKGGHTCGEGGAGGLQGSGGVGIHVGRPGTGGRGGGIRPTHAARACRVVHVWVTQARGRWHVWDMWVTQARGRWHGPASQPPTNLSTAQAGARRGPRGTSQPASKHPHLSTTDKNSARPTGP